MTRQVPGSSVNCRLSSTETAVGRVLSVDVLYDAQLDHDATVGFVTSAHDTVLQIHSILADKKTRVNVKTGSTYPFEMIDHTWMPYGIKMTFVSAITTVDGALGLSSQFAYINSS